MNREPTHPLRAKMICVLLAVFVWWLIKSQMEPNFWQKEWTIFKLRQLNETGKHS